MSLAWRLRAVMTPANRARARRAADVVLRPIGSVSGARRPADAYAMTFDDGPDPLVTPRLLDALDEAGVSATFFLLSDRVGEHPALAAEIAARGHEVALHGDRHDRMTRVPVVEVFRRLRAARARVEDVVGVRVRWYRPPFGAQTPARYLAARAAGLDVVVWGPYAAEWEDGTPQEVAERAFRGLRPGTVLLLHDGLEVPQGEPVPVVDRNEAFDLVLAGSRSRGLRPVTVSTLLSGGGTRRTAWFRP